MDLVQSTPPVVESGFQPSLYQQIYPLIPDRIMGGEYPDQSLLPSEHKVPEIKQGAPLRRISRIVHDRRRRVVEYIVGLYRPDQFQYDMYLSWVDNGIR